MGVHLDLPAARRGRLRDAGVSHSADVAATGRVWKLPGDLGRKYAAVSGDHNPIHLYPLTAKALGFPRQIAHGMWTWRAGSPRSRTGCPTPSPSRWRSRSRCSCRARSVRSHAATRAATFADQPEEARRTCSGGRAG